MIDLFHTPRYHIDTSRFSHLLHDPVVQEFEENFCQYVGARYGCSVNSATSAILLLFAALTPKDEVEIPSIIPHVVVNALMNSDCMVRFIDNVDWVGNSYVLHEFKGKAKIIDSAHKVDRNQFVTEANNYDLMVFSFYPTKPVGGQDGGIVVSNDQTMIEHLRTLTFNGTVMAEKSWERIIERIGHKMYMNSTQAFIANENLKVLDFKKERLAKIRLAYNTAFGYENTSDHLFRLNVENNTKFVAEAKAAGITCGIHYRAAHKVNVYKEWLGERTDLPLSDFQSEHTISIPFHENLSLFDIQKVIDFTLPYIHA